MNRIGAKRLMILARHHMAYKEPKKPGPGAIGWDMRKWINGTAGFDTVDKKKHPCGTTCCSLGHACYIPELKKAGLSWKKNEYGIMRIKFWRFMHEGAAEVFFGLTCDETYHLFVPHDTRGRVINRTPKQQAREIIKLVKKYHPDIATLEKK